MAKKKKKKLKIKYTKSSNGVVTLHIDPNDIKVRNELHFSIQKNTRAQVYKDKTKYTRKRKHKNQEDWLFSC